ncbi:hypothetical protein F8M41_017561 [Gigaspora margarita]|uniref:Uncharacterized protein n=1 Tax=Gigaspora margarita TaxID=4874 RepID=A0A8H4ELW8_GIGMA|nr:hypothetical protein F8M41_017561 [Gigaspora margarita]
MENIENVEPLEIDDDLYIIKAMENAENNDIKSAYSILLDNRNNPGLIEVMDDVEDVESAEHDNSEFNNFSIA